MIYSGQHHSSGRSARKRLFAALGSVMMCVMASPGRAVTHATAPWRIESFCHRGVSPARRCLVRARQGIIVFQLVELPSPPTTRWSDSVAVLTSGANDKSRQLRFYVPPQKLSAPFTQVRAYDTRQQLVAFYAGGRLHLRAMFAADRDLAVLALPTDISMDTLQVRFEGRSAQASWHDRTGHTQEKTLDAGD